MKKFLVIAVFCLPAFGQAAYSGSAVYSGLRSASAGGAPAFFAALPIDWVDNTICNPPGGVYDTTVLLGTTNNIGPNDAGESIGSPYALTPAGIQDAMNNWRDNADNASQTPHFADKWWLVEIPAGTSLHGIPQNSNTPLVSIPGKVSGTSEPTKCLVLDSTTPLTTGVMACGRGLPGFGGTRNPGCSSPDDKASMWKIQLDGPLSSTGWTALFAGQDPSNSSVTQDCYGNSGAGCWANHVRVNDVEVTLAAGAAQSKQGAHAPRLVDVDSNPLNILPCVGCQAVDNFFLDRYYVHGNNPGDPSQPSGACAAWTNTGTVNVAPDAGNPGTSLVTLTSNGAYFGMTFTVGSIININGTNQTIANTSYTQANLLGTGNTQLSITGSVTATGVAYTQSNPPSQYANGCGDDVQNGVIFNCDSCSRQNGYIEKIHWWGSESHASLQGFSNGPYKDVNNWEEGGSNAFFSGGGPIDQQGGPESNNEIRRNYFGRDLNWRQLSAAAGNSPSPPWGCGTADSTASHNTCPFSWAIKNSMEFKLGRYDLLDGNIIENSWADAQTGFCLALNIRVCSGGQTCGIYDPVTGLPRTYVDNIRVSNNWLRNCALPEINSDRSETAGGGVGAPVQSLDFINNLFSNVADVNQTGNSGRNIQWTGGQNKFSCVPSYTGTGPYTVTAICVPVQSDFSSLITEISSASNVVTVLEANRADPILCTGSAATCIADGQTLILSNHAGWDGAFAMTGTTGNWAADGTGGNNFVYTDTINSPGTATLCSNKGTPTCTSLLNSGDVTIASLAYKMTDISVGDDVYATNVGGGDTTCTTNGYAVGATSSTYAITGTVANGLTVVYQVANRPGAGAATCIINNGAGFPKDTTFQNNTSLSPNVFSVLSLDQFYLPISNYFFNNVFADNDTGKSSDLDCEPIGAGEGYPSFQCWDQNTFEFYGNVLMGRNAANWNSGTPIPSNQTANSFPPLASGYPAGACVYDGSNPFNCPMMALPYSTNFSLANVQGMSITSSTQGVQTNQLSNAMTQGEYICPAGANCGTHGPYPDN